MFFGKWLEIWKQSIFHLVSGFRAVCGAESIKCFAHKIAETIIIGAKFRPVYLRSGVVMNLLNCDLVEPFIKKKMFESLGNVLTLKLISKLYKMALNCIYPECKI